MQQKGNSRNSKCENPMPGSEMVGEAHARLRTVEKPLGAKSGLMQSTHNFNEFGSRYFPRTSRKDTVWLTP